MYIYSLNYVIKFKISLDSKTIKFFNVLDECLFFLIWEFQIWKFYNEFNQIMYTYKWTIFLYYIDFSLAQIVVQLFEYVTHIWVHGTSLKWEITIWTILKNRFIKYECFWKVHT